MKFEIELPFSSQKTVKFILFEQAILSLKYRTYCTPLKYTPSSSTTAAYIRNTLLIGVLVSYLFVENMLYFWYFPHLLKIETQGH